MRSKNSSIIFEAGTGSIPGNDEMEGGYVSPPAVRPP